MVVNKRSLVPIYYQLKQIIIENIKNGKWLPGQIISSERELSEEFSVSRMTIRQAVNELVNEGILYREKGRGTFVSQPKVEQYDIMSFTEAASISGMNVITDVRAFEIEVPDLNIINKLEMQEYTDVYYIQRKRTAGNKIIGIEELYMPVIYCKDLKSKDLSGSLYKILKEDYEIDIQCIETSVEAVIPDKTELDLFEEDEIIPLLKVSGINITNSGLKLFYEESIYRSDKYLLNVRINRRNFK